MRAIALSLLVSTLSFGCAGTLKTPVQVSVFTTSPTAASVQDNEAIICSNENLTGDCRVLIVGNYANPSQFTPVSDNSVRSMAIGRGARVIFFDNQGFAGRKTFYDGGAHYEKLRGGNGEEVSSIAVIPAQGGRVASIYQGNYPSDRENFWSENTQGLANDGESWFLIHGFRADDTRLYKVPLTFNLSSHSLGNNLSVGIPGSLKALGYGHFGDPDRSGEFLFVPVQGADVPPLIAVFSTKDLHYISSAEIPSLEKSGGGWVAIRPGANTLWVSEGAVAKGRPLSEYTIDWDALRTNGSLYLSLKQRVDLYGWDGTLPASIPSMQGGVFNSQGTILYIASGYCDTKGFLHAFYISNNKGTLQMSSSDGDYAPFNYETHPEQQVCAFGACACSGDEAEGIDWLDVEGKGVPGVPKGKLHVVLIDNDLLSKDNLFLKHYGN